MRRPLETLWRGCSRSLFYLVVAFGVMLFFSTVYISRHSARSEHQQSLTITVPVSNNNDFSRIRCTEPQSLKSSCHAQNVCYNNDHLVVYSDDKELRRRFDGQSFLLGPMHRQPLRPDRLKGWHYDYELRMTTRVQPNHAAKRSQMMFVDEQVLMIGMTGFGHYGHWLMDAVAPAFHMMRRWARLDYNSRIWMKKRQPDQTPQSMADGWTRYFSC
ncbi:hypothetical protein DFJ77DRAFT_318483 [Powellomyces hirtus]|nr:hypothetical protein DFJ77DRAFT_318483 [Powellomyces hirtus]